MAEIDDDSDLGNGFSLREMFESRPAEVTAEAPAPIEQTAPAPEPLAPAAADPVAPVTPEVAPPTPAQTAFIRDKLRSRGYEVTDDEDDDALLNEIEQAHAAARDPAAQQLIEHGKRYQQHAPAFEAWYHSQMTGGQQTPAPTPEPTVEAPKGPLADWNQAPEYQAWWDKACVYDAAIGQYTLRPEAVGKVDPSIAPKLTAARKWMSDRGERVVREFPKLAGEIFDDRMTGAEERILAKVRSELEERTLAAQIQNYTVSRKADFFHLDPTTGEIAVDANGRERRKPLGDAVARRTAEFKVRVLGVDPRTRLTTQQTLQAMNWAVPLAESDWAVHQASQTPAPSPAAAPAPPAPVEPVAPEPSPKKRFVEQAIENAKLGGESGSHRGAARPEDIDDDTDFEDDPRVTFSDIHARAQKRQKANGRV